MVWGLGSRLYVAHAVKLSFHHGTHTTRFDLVGKTSETLFSVSMKKLNDAFNHGDIVI